jgi:hypothetical protein
LKKLLLTNFTNNFIPTLLGIFTHEIGKKSFFHIGNGADILTKKRSRKITASAGADILTKKRSGKITASALNPFSELSLNLYYSPIKKLENIFIFKFVKQKRPVTKVGKKRSYTTSSKK